MLRRFSFKYTSCVLGLHPFLCFLIHYLLIKNFHSKTSHTFIFHIRFSIFSINSAKSLVAQLALTGFMKRARVQIPHPQLSNYQKKSFPITLSQGYSSECKIYLNFTFSYTIMELITCLCYHVAVVFYFYHGSSTSLE
jgi:hypothetical protein